MTVKESNAHLDYELVGIEIESQLSAVIREPQDTVYFGGRGGAFDQATRSLSGIGPRGIPVSLTPRAGDVLILTAMVGGLPDTIRITWLVEKRRLSKWRKVAGQEGRFPPMRLIPFKRGLATLDRVTNTAIGQTSDGRHVTLQVRPTDTIRLNVAFPCSPRRFGMYVGGTAGGYWGDFPAGVSVTKPRLFGIQASLTTTWPLGGNFLFQPEIAYALHRAKIRQSGVYLSSSIESTDDIQTTGLQVPMLLKYRLGDFHSSHPTLFAGPMFSWVAEAKSNYDSLRTGEGFATGGFGTRVISNRESVTLGVVLGAEYEFVGSRWSPVISLRFVTGLTNSFGENTPMADSRAYVDSDGNALSLKANSVLFTIGLSAPW